jgi:hypothetical protein
MFFQSFTGRALGLSMCAFLSAYCPGLNAAGSSSSARAEVGIKYKAADLPAFHLADFQEELLECSALAAIHMWIGDNIGTDPGSEVRKALDEDYWLEISKEYLSLAKQASGNADLSEEVSAEIKGLTVEWQRLTETNVSDTEWAGWYKLVDQCDTWRPEKTSRAYYSKGRDAIAAQGQAPNVAMGPQ